MWPSSLCPYIVLATVIVTVAACATPTERVDRVSETAGFERKTVTGDPFEHLILTNNTDSASGTDLHVYIEGDGSPWIAGRWAATDPTPQTPVMLRLMQLDPGPALYLGRPCYFGLQRSCEPENWTDGRYSQTVLRSMSIALHTALERLASQRDIVLIGHSGGGVLAMLLAPQVPRVSGVVTLAANLDTDSWTEYHGYRPLSTSLNPANEAPLPKYISQLHLVGESDPNVPVQLIQPVVDRQPQAQLLRYPGYDHTCCWAEIWPAVLERLPR